MSAIAEEATKEAGKQEMENDIRAVRKWRESVRRGEFSGSDCQAIGGLLKWLDDQHDALVAKYESMLQAKPEWGRPSDLKPEANA